MAVEVKEGILYGKAVLADDVPTQWQAQNRPAVLPKARVPKEMQ